MKKLVQAAKEGDRRAMRTLFDRFHPAVLGYCMLCAKYDKEQALDLAQEIFFRAFSKLHRLQDPERFRGWLFTIAANVCRTEGAKETRLRKLQDALAMEIENSGPVPGDQYMRELRIKAVRDYLDQIEDETLKRIVKMKYTEPEHTTRQIASKLGIPHGTVTVKLSRFRARIKKDMARAILAVEEECHAF